MSSISMTPSITSTTLLTKQELPDAFRLEFHNKNDQMIAELYKSNILQAVCSLEEVSIKRWEYELSTESIQHRIKRFLIAHHVPIATENMIERETQTSYPTPQTSFATSSLLSHLSSSDCPSNPLSFFSSLSPSILQDIPRESEREAAGSVEEPELSVGSFSCVSPMLSSHLFSHESSFTQEIDSHKRKRTTKRTLQEKAKALRSSPSQSSPSNKSSPSNLLNFPSSDSLVGTSSPHQLVPLEILEHQLIKLDYPQQKLEVLLQTACREQNKRIVVDALFHHLLALKRMPALDPLLLDVRNSQGYTLLLAAVALGDQAKFEATLPLYKDQDALYIADPYGRNALHLAAAFGHATLIPRLIDEGFELNVKDHNGLMPLHWAIHTGHIETVQTLVTSGASLVDPWVTPDGRQYSPLELAIVTGDPAVLNLLLTSDRLGQLNLTQSVQGRGTLLHLAIYANQAPMLKHLLSLHSEKIQPLFTHKDPHGRTPFQLAAYLGDEYAIYLLFQFQPKIEETTEEKLRAMLSSTYTAKETLSIFRVKGEQEWEFKLPIEEMYVRLGMIERSKGKMRDQTLDKQSTYLQDERIATYETIFEPKKELKLEKLFEHESLQGKERKRIYIQGAAGSGKSTLCHYIAYRWAKGNLWNSSFKYLFWIPLRNLTKERYPDTKAYTPIDLIIQEYEGEIDLRMFQTYLEQPDLRHHTLIVLDGYDELSSDAQRGMASLAKAFNELKELFPHLLITSRPGLRPFERSCDLELLGFDRQGITDYIDKFFTQVRGEEKKKKLEEILNQSPHALSLARIPINLTLLCSLFHENPTIFTSPSSLTMTFIYERIVNWLYQWFMLKRIDRGESKQTKEKILEEANLRCNREVATIAKVLEEMAYFAMKEDTLYLGRREIDDFRGTAMSSNELIDLGLLRISEERGYFIHLTFQEFLTASKMANHYLSGESGRDFVRSYKFNPRFALIFYLIAGCLSLSAATNRRYREALQLFFDDLFGEPHDLAISYELNLLAGCFEECQDPTQIKQYPTFIEVVTEYMIKLVQLGLNFRLLDRREKLLSQPKVIAMIQHLLDDPTTVKKMLTILSRNGIAGRLTPELIKLIVNLLKTFDAKCTAARALGAVAKQGGSSAKEALEALIHLLKEGDSFAKSSTAYILGAVAKQGIPFPKEVLEALIHLLKEGDSFAKSSAAYILGVVAQQESSLAKEALKALIYFFKEGDSLAKSFAAEALGEVAQQGSSLAKEALKILVQVLKEGNSFAKSSTTEALGAVAKQGIPFPKEVLEALIHLLKEGDFFVKRSAAQALRAVVKQGAPLAKGVLKALIQLLIEGDSFTKISVAYILGEVAQQGGSFAKEALEALIQLLIEGDSFTKISAAYILGVVAQQGGSLAKEALQILVQVLKEGDSFAKSSTAEALGAVAKQGIPFPKEVLEVLIHLLKEGDSFAKSAAAYILGVVAQQRTPVAKEALKALIHFFKEGDSLVKSFTAEALGEVAQQGGPLAKDALEILVQVLKEGNSFAKSSTAEALGAVAKQGIPFPKEVLEALIHLLKEGDFFVKSSAAHALGAIVKQGTPLAKEVLKTLIPLLKGGNNYAKSSAVAPLAAVIQQGGSLAKEALESFIQNLKWSNNYAKSSAAEALGEVAKQGTPLSKEVVEALIPLLKGGNNYAKSSAVIPLEAVTQQGGSLAKEVLESFIQNLKWSNRYAKSSAAEALGEVAKQGGSLAKEALEVLVQVLKEGNSFAKSSTAEALGAVAKQRGSLVKEALEGFIQNLKWSNRYAESSAAEALVEIAKQGGSLAKEALEVLVQFLNEDDSSAKGSAVFALRAINKDILLKMNEETIPLIAEVCFFSDNSFSIQDRQFQISDQRTIYHSTVETKLYYEEIRENLPKVLAKWRKQLDGLSFSSTSTRDKPLYH